jgi:hypothetical protein
MRYRITADIKTRADSIGVSVKPSKRQGKKLDVYRDGVYQASIGDIRYPDYHVWIKTKGITYANQRRRLYHARHKDTPPMKNGKYTANYLAKVLLW